MSPILVVCYSRGGTTLEVASRIAERCGADLELARFVSRLAGDRDAPTTSGMPLSDRAGL